MNQARSISIDDLSHRGIDVLLHSLTFGEEPEKVTASDGRVGYKIKKIRQGYKNYTKKPMLEEGFAPLPYYSTNVRDFLALIDKKGVDYSINYVNTSGSYLASIRDIHIVHETMVGAISRAYLIWALKQKFNDGITVYYTVLKKQYIK